MMSCSKGFEEKESREVMRRCRKRRGFVWIWWVDREGI